MEPIFFTIVIDLTTPSDCRLRTLIGRIASIRLQSLELIDQNRRVEKTSNFAWLLKNKLMVR